MRMLVTVEFADAGVKTGTHRVLVVGGCSDMAVPGDIGMSLEEAKTLLSALQWEFVAAQAAEITESKRHALCFASPMKPSRAAASSWHSSSATSTSTRTAPARR